MSDVCDWRAGTPFNKTPFDPIVVGVVEPAVMVPALKFPLPSRSTIVEAVFAVAYAIDDVTVVAEAATGNWPVVMPDNPPLPEPHAAPASASVPAVSPNFTQSFSVVVVGPVVIPAPVPASGLLLVTVLAVAATGICPAVMPEIPLDVR